MIEANELLEDLRELGVESGDLLCIHSSYKSIGTVNGGADTVIKSLLTATGDAGTLLFPAFTFYLLNEENPVFDVVESPSCVGYLSEFFRCNYATGRSIHLSHSYSACGRYADKLLTHDLEITPCGIDSPLGKLMQMGGKILMIGCGYNTLTAAHVAEELMKVPYVRFKENPGARYRRNGVLHPLSSKTVYPFHYDFERLAPHLEESGAVRYGKFGAAATMLISGRGLLETACKLLENSPCFLEKSSQ